MPIPTNDDILQLLDQLDHAIADNLESETLDFKPWNDSKNDMKVAIEYAVCFSNADGGVVVFGVSDKTLGRSNAIHGVKAYTLDTWRRGIFDGTTPHIHAEVEELTVPEGTGQLLIVRIPKGDNPPYGTTQGLFKQRVGKNCMPMDPAVFASSRVSTGAVDWSGQPVHGITFEDLDSFEIARARAILRSKNPESELLKMSDEPFLRGLEAIRGNNVTNTGLLLFGKSDIISALCPQNQVHYVHQPSETKVARNDLWRIGLLQIIEKIENIFSSPTNPEEEIQVGLFNLRIPAFPLDVVREVVLNAVTHRDYTNPGEVLIRHASQELVVTSPGGFIGGITLQNILRHESAPRNRTLANAFLKLRLVESAGTGRRKIFIPMLEYGKRMPHYEADSSHVTLHIFDGSFDHVMASLIARWHREGKDIGLDELIVLTHLKDHRFISTDDVSNILQLDRNMGIAALDKMSHPKRGILERKGHTKTATYYLAKPIAKELIGKVAYSKSKGIDPIRYPEMVRDYLQSHGVITNKECRQLLDLGDSDSAQVEASRHLKKWSGDDGFLVAEGKGSQRKYRLKGS
ncbi:putative DNA binding domain-containing protein [Methanospirillum purgamenti]|uniref:DNA binding domain-containing protein n=1 Tax=Methanospirillum hungatei TaxID=2203 RepID=A0A8F5ZFZ8_METHU|nr:RNA-binding domain-containing protein [Methanospirillum hungatei]QXO96055.1 putative DNA binding domain-containing protein [Methanospirillum hungatei]